MAVNNNASAVLLGLAAIAAGREVIVSRGEEVEIGGGFRIPDVLRQSGATLVEVGTTNRTYIDDYRAAITQDTAARLKVHPSNFSITGFTHAPPTAGCRGPSKYQPAGRGRYCRSLHAPSGRPRSHPCYIGRRGRWIPAPPLQAGG